jgi:methylmalonyl-CoA/ethylmalonyl-CoA epimerase
MLKEIGQLSVNVHDVQRAIRFYRDTLGLHLLFEAPPQMAFFQCGGVRLMLAEPGEPEHDHPSSVIYFKVEDIEATHRTLVERGVTFEGEPHVVHKVEGYELRMAFMRDSENNLLALMSEQGEVAAG